MYPVQLVKTYHITMKNHHRCVTIYQYTGGGYPRMHLHNTFIQINKQMQGFVRLVLYRYDIGQCRHILSFLACLHTWRQTYRAAGT